MITNLNNINFDINHIDMKSQSGLLPVFPFFAICIYLIKKCKQYFLHLFISAKKISILFLHFASLEHNLFLASDNAIFYVISYIYPIYIYDEA